MIAQEIEYARSQAEQLDRARAEIEALKNELAQTKRELQRSNETAELNSSDYMRHSASRMRSVSYAAGPTEPIRQPANRSPLNQIELDVNSASSRPIETMTGRAMSRNVPSQSSSAPQTTFMMYAQPLCSKLGPQKVHEALHLAQGIWNAAVMGGQAINEIYASAEGMPALIKLIEAMIIRKNKYFAEEYWQIDNLSIQTDAEGRLSIHFDTR